MNRGPQQCIMYFGVFPPQSSRRSSKRTRSLKPWQGRGSEILTDSKGFGSFGIHAPASQLRSSSRERAPHCQIVAAT